MGQRYWSHGHGHGRGHREFDLEKASLEGLLIRSGYLAERKSGKYRGQRQILDILSVQTEMSQRALQERLEIEAGSLSELLSKLEEKGLLCRKRDEEDRRRMIVCLTEEGREEARRMGEKESGGDILAALCEDEKQQLKELLLKLLRQWKAERNLSREIPEEEAEGKQGEQEIKEKQQDRKEMDGGNRNVWQK